MTDKVQKIKDWISKTQDGLMDDNGNFENTSDEGAFHILSNLDYYIDSLQEEPVSEDFEMALAEMVDKAQKCVVEPWVVAAQWKDELIKLAKSEEPISEELEKAAEQDVCEVVNTCSAIGIPNDHIPSWVQEAMVNEFIHGAKWLFERVNEALLSEVLPCFMHGGEACEVVAKLDEVLNQKK